MAQRSLAPVQQIRSPAFPAQLCALPAAAGACFQRFYPFRRTPSSCLVLDVVTADRLHFSASGGQFGERYLSNGLRAGRSRFCFPRKDFSPAIGSWVIAPFGLVIDRGKGE